ncbi:MAG: 30S ribosomal protein S4 [Clostridia bacterium]|nr:30S ribosomal protein S4 [Clostridia bacterium]
MARYTDSVCRQCRREGCKLFLKGERCYGPKCAFTKRPTPPGMHGISRRRASQYGAQLREKQKARRAYGLQEKQFRSYFEKASRMQGVTGENLLILLERRLDNAVFRLGMGESRAHARQLVCHGHICVNGKKVDIPSYLLRQGDEITVRESSQGMEHLKALREEGNRSVPKWLSLDAANLKGSLLALPQRDDIDLTIEEHQIVELYSR